MQMLLHATIQLHHLHVSCDLLEGFCNGLTTLLCLVTWTRKGLTSETTLSSGLMNLMLQEGVLSSTDSEEDMVECRSIA